MNNLFRGLLAGAGAAKLGGGCFSTILIFVLLWVLLGQCGAALPPAHDPPHYIEAVSAPGPVQAATPFRKAR
jgi:hypothetical protein